MKKILLLILILPVLYGCAGAGPTKTHPGFQADADIYRLNHLKYYGELLDEYHKKTGTYPYIEDSKANDNVPIYVMVANSKQEKYTKKGPPYKHGKVSFKDFVAHVEEVLGRTVDEYYDPQYAPDYKPNFYIYMVRGDSFFFAVHVHNDFGFANKVADYYYKVEISNRPDSENMARNPKKLFISEEFKKEFSKSPTKPAFFKAREDKFISETK